MSTPLSASTSASHSLGISHAEVDVKESFEKAEKDQPFCQGLSETQHKLLQTVAARKYPLVPKCTHWTTATETIIFPTLSFSAFELCQQLKLELEKQGMPCGSETSDSEMAPSKMTPYISGGAASYLMGGPDYADVDLCYYIKKADFGSIKKAVVAAIGAFLYVSHNITLSFKTIEDVYLYRKKLIEESQDLSAFYGLGGIELKFIYKKFRQNVSTSDSFLVGLYSCAVWCVKVGGGWANAREFHAAVDNLHNRKFVVKSPESTVGLIYRMVHRLTQGFSIDRETLEVALRQLLQPGEDIRQEVFAKGLASHINNHYGKNGLPKLFDFLNFLAILNGLKDRHAYVRTLASVWINNAQEFGKEFVYMAKLLEKHKNTDVGEHFLAVMRGMLLCQWLSGEGGITAYAPASTTKPYMGGLPSTHMSFAHAGGTHYLYLEHSPEKVAIAFITSLSAMFKLCPTLRDAYYLSGLFRSLKCLPFNKDGQAKALSLLCASFDKPPLTSICEEQFKDRDCARNFYAFAVAHFAENPCPGVEPFSLALRLAKSRLQRHVDELRALGAKRAFEFVKGLMACLDSFEDEKLCHARLAKASVMLKVPAEVSDEGESKELSAKSEEKTGQLFSLSAKLTEDIDGALQVMLAKSRERRDVAAISTIFQVYLLADGLGAFSKESQQAFLFLFIEAMALAEIFPAWGPALIKRVDASGLFTCKPQVSHQLALLFFLQKTFEASSLPLSLAYKFLHNLLGWAGESALCHKALMNTALAIMRSSLSPPESTRADFSPETAQGIHSRNLFQTFLLLQERFPSLLRELSTAETNRWHTDLYIEGLKIADKTGDKELLRLAYRCVEQIVKAHLPDSPVRQSVWERLDALLQRQLDNFGKKSRYFYDFILRHIVHLLASQVPHKSFHAPLLHFADRLCLLAEDPAYKEVQESFQKMASSVAAQLGQPEATAWPRGALERSLRRVLFALEGADAALALPKALTEFAAIYAAAPQADEELKQRDLMELQKMGQTSLRDFKKQSSQLLYRFIPVVARLCLAWAQEFLKGAQAHMDKEHLWNLALFLVKRHLGSKHKDYLLRACAVWTENQRLIADTFKTLTEFQLAHCTSISAELLMAIFKSEDTLKSFSGHWERVAETLIQMLKKTVHSLEIPKDPSKASSQEAFRSKIRESLLGAIAAIVSGGRPVHFNCAEKMLLTAVQAKHLLPSDVKKACSLFIQAYNKRLMVALSDADTFSRILGMVKQLIGLYHAEKKPVEDEDLDLIFASCQIFSLAVEPLMEKRDGERELLSFHTLFALFISEKEKARGAWTREIIDLAKILITYLGHSKSGTNSLLALQIGHSMAVSASFTAEVWTLEAEIFFSKLVSICLVQQKSASSSIALLVDILEKLLEKELLQSYTSKGLLALSHMLIHADQMHSWELNLKILHLSENVEHEEYLCLLQILFQKLSMGIEKTQNIKPIELLCKRYITSDVFHAPVYLQLMEMLAKFSPAVQAKCFRLMTTILAPSVVYKDRLGSGAKPLHPHMVFMLIQMEVCLLRYMESLQLSKLAGPDKLPLACADFALKEENWMHAHFIKRHAAPEIIEQLSNEMQGLLPSSFAQIDASLFQILTTLPLASAFERLVKFILGKKVADCKKAHLDVFQIFCSLSAEAKMQVMQTSLLDLLNAEANKHGFVFESEEGLAIFSFLNALCHEELGDARWDILERALVFFGKPRLPWMIVKKLPGNSITEHRSPARDSIFLKIVPYLHLQISCLIPHVSRLAAPAHSYASIELVQALSKQILEISSHGSERSDLESLMLVKLDYFAKWVFSLTMDRHEEISEAVHNFALYLPDYAKLSKVQGVEVLCFIAEKLFASTPRWAGALLYLFRRASTVKLFTALPTKEAQIKADSAEMMMHLGLFSMLAAHKFTSNFTDLLEVFQTLIDILIPHCRRNVCLQETLGLHRVLSASAMCYALVNHNTRGFKVLYQSFSDILCGQSAHAAVISMEFIKNVIYELMHIPAMFYHCHQIIRRETGSVIDSEPLLALALLEMKALAQDLPALSKCLESLLAHLPEPRQNQLLATLQHVIFALDLGAYKSASIQDVTVACQVQGLCMYTFLRIPKLKEKSAEVDALFSGDIKKCLLKTPDGAARAHLLRVFDILQTPWTKEAIGDALKPFPMDSIPMPPERRRCPSCPDLALSDIPNFGASTKYSSHLRVLLERFSLAFPGLKEIAARYMQAASSKEEASGKEEAFGKEEASRPLKSRLQLGYMCPYVSRPHRHQDSSSDRKESSSSSTLI